MFMFLRRQIPQSAVLSIVWYFTGGNQHDGTLNMFLLLEELENKSYTYVKRRGMAIKDLATSRRKTINHLSVM